jgi:hypothetical protein
MDEKLHNGQVTKNYLKIEFILSYCIPYLSFLILFIATLFFTNSNSSIIFALMMVFGISLFWIALVLSQAYFVTNLIQLIKNNKVEDKNIRAGFLVTHVLIFLIIIISIQLFLIFIILHSLIYLLMTLLNYTKSL